MSAYIPYPKYKDSGVEWLGEVPVGWEVSRIKNVSTINASKAEVSHLNPDTEISFLPMEAVGDDGSLDTSTNRQLPYDLPRMIHALVDQLLASPQ